MRKLSELPHPRRMPIFGNFFDIDYRQFHLQLENWGRELGPEFTFKVGPRTILCLSDADEINQILKDRPERFRRRRTFEAVIDEMGFNGVFSAEGENWRRQRKLVAQALNSAHLNRFFPNLQKSVYRLRDHWRGAAASAERVDLCKDLMRFTVDVTSELAFGRDVNTIETEGPVIQQHLDKVFPMLGKRVNMPIPFWRWFPSQDDKALEQALASIAAELKQVISDCQQRIAADPSILAKPSNFLEAIIAAQKENREDFSDQDIYANVLTLLLAGEDTTANSIAWATKFLIDYPDQLERMRSEVENVIGDSGIAENFEQLHELQFIDAFINETMRLKPVAPLNGLETNVATTIADIEVPAGTPVLALTRYSATDQVNFSEPERFYPERWLQPEIQAAHEPKAFLPFGTGPRFCPGRNLALAESKIVLAMMCRNFDFALASDAKEVREKLTFTMFPANMFVHFTECTEPPVNRTATSI